MAKSVIYKGPAHIRRFGAADEAKYGFPAKDFIRGEATEVSDEGADALIKLPKLAGKFELVQEAVDNPTTPEPTAEVEAPAEAPAEPVTDDEELDPTAQAPVDPTLFEDETIDALPAGVDQPNSKVPKSK